MRVLALANQKGGCGKTTTAIHLAAALAASGRRVLLVDLDPQAHATLGLGHDAPSDAGRDLAAVLRGDASLESILRDAPGGFALAPASLALSDFELRAERELAAERRLSLALSQVDRRFDWALIDCPPRAEGLLCANALRACDEIVLVVETGAFALQGALRAREIFRARAQEAGRELPMSVLATIYDRRTRFAREVLIALQARFGPDLYDVAIRESVRLREAAGYGVPVQLLDPRSPAAADFAALARELVARDARREPRVEAPAASVPLTESSAAVATSL